MAKGRGIMLTDMYVDLLIDVKRDALGLITSGLVIGDTLFQNQSLIITSCKGEVPGAETLGVGAVDYLDDDDTSSFLREVRVNLRQDGQTVKSCGFGSDGKLQIAATYGND